MEARLIGISPEAFAAAFPFHIVFDRDLKILQAGPSLRRVCPAVAPGALASSCLLIRRPLVSFDFEAIKAQPRAVFVIDAGGGQLSLRGQMIADEAAGTVTFLGSPKVSDLGMVVALGLSLDDFAVHDATADLLLLIQSKNTTLADAKKLTAELTGQKAELRRTNKRLMAQFAVTRVLIEAPSIDAAMSSVLAALGEGLDCAVGAWWEVEERAQALRCAEVWRPSARRFGRFDAALRGIAIPHGSGLPGQTFTRKEPMWAGEIVGECPLVNLAATHELRDAFAFPVLVDDATIGVIGFFCEGRSPPEKDLRQLLLDTGVKIGQFAERRRAEEALRESEERYALAALGAKDGLWDWKLKTGNVYYSPRWKAMLGADEGAVADTLDEWFKRVHPDDRGGLEAELAAHLEGQRDHFEVEHRMIHEDGTYRWVLVRGIAVRDDDGNAVRMAGTQTDVTERKIAELALVQAREDLAQKLTLVEEQERAIRELSTPIIRVWEGVLALPVIGALDEARARQMTERLLGELSKTQARVAVLDLTGAAAMDVRTAEHLIRILRAARLLGSQCVVAGLSSGMARSFVELDVDVRGHAFFADVKSALAWVFRGRA